MLPEPDQRQGEMRLPGDDGRVAHVEGAHALPQPPVVVGGALVVVAG